MDNWCRCLEAIGGDDGSGVSGSVSLKDDVVRVDPCRWWSGLCNAFNESFLASILFPRESDRSIVTGNDVDALVESVEMLDCCRCCCQVISLSTAVFSSFWSFIRENSFSWLKIRSGNTLSEHHSPGTSAWLWSWKMAGVKITSRFCMFILFILALLLTLNTKRSACFIVDVFLVALTLPDAPRQPSVYIGVDQIAVVIGIQVLVIGLHHL